MIGESAWRRVTIALVAVWLIAVARLGIADVWDETNGLLVFSNRPAGEMIHFVFTRSVGFWRPIPTLFAALVIDLLGNNDATWIVLRAINTVMLLCALSIFTRTMEAWDGPSSRRTALFTLAFLYSAGAVIAATWFANLFDVWTLLLIAGAVALLQRGRALLAGALIGLAFFCKETAFLALPLLLMLIAIRRLRWRDAVKAAVPAAIGGIVYFGMRSAIIPFGSASDTHTFAMRDLAPAVTGLLDTWWIQSMWFDGPTIVGSAFFVFTVVAMRGWRARCAYLAFVACTAGIYWGMTGNYQHHQVVHYLMFAGRLFLIPATLTLFVLLLDRRWWAVAVVSLPLLWGAVVTCRQYERFQRSYRNIYRRARTFEPKPLRIHYPMKPLDDRRRGIVIGDFPDALWKLDPANGKLVRQK